MKKFIMTSPFQPERNLSQGIYHAVDNPRLQYDKPTTFPIIPVIHGYAQPGEEIAVYVLHVPDHADACRNLETFRSELNALCTDMGITYTLHPVETRFGNELDTLLDQFGKLIDCTADGDTLFACFSYGFKPTPLIMSMALNYGHRIRQNTSIGCVVYGEKNFASGELRIYDVTSLLYMDEIVRIMADQKISDPTAAVKRLLH